MRLFLAALAAAGIASVQAQIDPAACATASTLKYNFDLSAAAGCYKGTVGEHLCPRTDIPARGSRAAGPAGPPRAAVARERSAPARGEETAMDRQAEYSVEPAPAPGSPAGAQPPRAGAREVALQPCVPRGRAGGRGVAGGRLRAVAPNPSGLPAVSEPAKAATSLGNVAPR